MKRSTLPALIIGLAVAGLIIALQVSGALLRPEFVISDFVSRHNGPATAAIAEKWQYLLVTLVALAVAWVTIQSSRPRRSWWMLAIFLVELLGAAWVLGLFQVFFQPLPSLLAAGVAFIVAGRFRGTASERRRRFAMERFSGRLARRKIDELIEEPGSIEPQPMAQEVTALLCDIGNKLDLAGERSPAEYATLSEKFIERACDLLRDEGAYIHAADGEGIVAFFGYPKEASNHAEQAARSALNLVQAFEAKAEGDDVDNSGALPGIHVGVSSGTIVAANATGDRSGAVMISGEPLELARRFCIANRSYGSRILIGPRTFELASESIVARPIDFLSGAEARDRLEVYEVLSLAAAANAEEIARRDSFWNGIVYYREKRWGEAYAAFQKAAAANGKEDAPAQLYLRRIEPLLLHLAESPAAIDPPL